MGNESERFQMAVELNGEFIGLAEGFTAPEITKCPEQGSVEMTSITGMEFSFTLHPTKKFMRRLRWVTLKNSLASFPAQLFPKWFLRRKKPQD